MSLNWFPRQLLTQHVLHPLDELGLVLPDGAADVGHHEQGVELGEDTEHLVSVLGRLELVPEDTEVDGDDDMTMVMMSFW